MIFMDNGLNGCCNANFGTNGFFWIWMAEVTRWSKHMRKKHNTVRRKDNIIVVGITKVAMKHTPVFNLLFKFRLITTAVFPRKAFISRENVGHDGKSKMKNNGSDP